MVTKDNKEVIVIDETTIKSKIYHIRNQKVMLDFDLAEIYGYSTMRFNEQVKRNHEKFDDDFMFQLTKVELENLISKNRYQVGEVVESHHMLLQSKAFICL